MKRKASRLTSRLLAWLLCLALVVPASILPTAANTPDGWVHEGDDVYYYKDGEMLTMWFDRLPCEETGEELWYFFQLDGKLFLAEPGQHDVEIDVGGGVMPLSYFGGEHHDLRIGLQEAGGKFYFYDPTLITNDLVPVYDEVLGCDVWYAFGSDGAAFTPEPGWHEFIQNWDNEDHIMTYYANDDGSIRIGWLDEGEKRYYFDPYLVSEPYYCTFDEATQRDAWYFFNEDGSARPVEPGVWGEYEYNDYGQPCTGVYYGAPDGSLSTGITEIDGKRYYFDPWLHVGGFSVWTEADGETWYIADENGVLLDTVGWGEYTTHAEWGDYTDRYYGNGDGTVYFGFLTIDDKTYYLDPWLRTGSFSVRDNEHDTETAYIADDNGVLLGTEPGWHEVERHDPWMDQYFTDKYYVDDSGVIANGFTEIDGKTYYFDPWLHTGGFSVRDNEGHETFYIADDSGVLLDAEPGWHDYVRTDSGDQQEHTDRYYVDQSGSIASGFTEIDGKTYYFDPWLRVGQFSIWDNENNNEVWYVTDDDGALLDMAPGWHTCERYDEWDQSYHTEQYYVNESGSIANGFTVIGEKTYYFDPYLRIGTIWLEDDQQNQTLYLTDETGALLTLEVGWNDVTAIESWGGQHNERCYGKEDGSAYVGFLTLGDKTYYLDPWLHVGQFTVWDSENQTETWYLSDEDGALLDMASGWHTVERYDEWAQVYRTERYYVDESGALANGFTVIGENTYYFDPYLRTGTLTFRDDAGERGYVTDQSGALLALAAGWNEIEVPEQFGSHIERYYGNGDGSAYVGWLTLGDKTYYLDPWLRTGTFFFHNEESGQDTCYLTDGDGALLDMAFGWHTVERYDAWDQSYHTEQYYVDENGSVANGFVEIQGEHYYFDPYLRTGEFTMWNAENDPVYYLTDDNGALLGYTEGFAQVTRVDPYDSKEYTYTYYGNGDGTIRRGWVDTDSGRYHFDPYMAQGFRQIYDEASDQSEWYFFKSDGTYLFTGAGALTDVNMTLSDSISLNFYAASSDMHGLFVEYTVGDGAKKIVNQYEMLDGEYSGMCRFTCQITAKDLAETVTVTLKDGYARVLDSATISGVGYLSQLTEEQGCPAETAALAQRVIEYGAAAESFFRNEGVTPTASVDPDDLTTYFHPQESVLADNGVSFYGKSLLAKQETILRLYFAADHYPMVRVAGRPGITAREYKEAGYYTVDIPVTARALSSSFSITVDGTQIQFSVGVYDYLAQALRDNEDGSPLSELCKALYRYSLAADALPPEA